MLVSTETTRSPMPFQSSDLLLGFADLFTITKSGALYGDYTLAVSLRTGKIFEIT